MGVFVLWLSYHVATMKQDSTRAASRLATANSNVELRCRGDEARLQLRVFGTGVFLSALCVRFAFRPSYYAAHQVAEGAVLAFALLGLFLSLSITAGLKIMRQVAAREKAKEAWSELAKRPLFGWQKGSDPVTGERWDEAQGLRQFAVVSADDTDTGGLVRDLWLLLNEMAAADASLPKWIAYRLVLIAVVLTVISTVCW